MIYGEADRLPGLIVDRYGDVLVMQTLSSGMDRRKEMLADLLCKETGLSKVYLRNDAKSRLLEGLRPVTGFLCGNGATTIEVQEGPARFLVDVAHGQKTGWYCDQRENRLAAARLAAGQANPRSLLSHGRLRDTGGPRWGRKQSKGWTSVKKRSSWHGIMPD